MSHVLGKSDRFAKPANKSYKTTEEAIVAPGLWKAICNQITPIQSLV